MLELNTVKKHKVNLSDYAQLEEDIKSRSLLADFSLFDLEVMEEILFSPLKTSLKKVSRSLGCSDSLLDPILSKLVDCRLLERQGDTLLIDKERRKYFEFQISRFEDGFKPDMEFLQGLLKQVPIHLLPIWYAIPRFSNNIFESIVEKYLLTPQIYQRYLAELHFSDPILNGIVHDLFTSEDLRLSSSDLIARYNLTRADFDRIMLLLEFHFVCFVSYSREEDHWHETISPFHEWREYILFLRQTEAAPISRPDSVFAQRPAKFSFVEDMSVLLSLAKKKPISLEKNEGSSLLRSLAHRIGLETDTAEEMRFAEQYLSRLIEKILLIRLAERVEGKICVLEAANDWLDLDLEMRAIHLHRHPFNRLLNESLSPSICCERNVREAEKSLKRVLQKGWVYFDDFLRGVIVPLGENSVVMLKRSGKQWKFTLPEYTEEEKALVKAVVFEWLFECGITMVGQIDGRDCFAVTPFGRIFFED